MAILERLLNLGRGRLALLRGPRAPRAARAAREAALEAELEQAPPTARATSEPPVHSSPASSTGVPDSRHARPSQELARLRRAWEDGSLTREQYLRQAALLRDDDTHGPQLDEHGEIKKTL